MEQCLKIPSLWPGCKTVMNWPVLCVQEVLYGTVIADIFNDDNLCDQQVSYIILKMFNSIISSSIWDSDS